MEKRGIRERWMKRIKLKLKEKRALEIEMLGWWIIAIAVLVILVIGYFILKAKGINMIEYIKNLFRFGR